MFNMRCRHFEMVAFLCQIIFMSVTIRKATENDFAAIIELINEFAIFQKTPGKVSITLQQMQEGKDLFQSFVAETNDHKIVGFASFYFAWFSWSGKGIYLDDLYVTELYRQQKIGSQLLNTVIDLGKKARCRKLRWQVSGWNKNAIGFYKSIGAVIDDTEINCDLNLLSRNEATLKIRVK